MSATNRLHSDTLRYPEGAMSLGGERAFGKVEARHWDKLATAVQLPAEQVLTWVTEYLPQIPDAIKQVPNTASDRTVLTDRLLPRIARLASLTDTGLTSASPGHSRRASTAAEELASITAADETDGAAPVGRPGRMSAHDELRRPVRTRRP